jgi:hypothetical protein
MGEIPAKRSAGRQFKRGELAQIARIFVPGSAANLLSCVA